MKIRRMLLETSHNLGKNKREECKNNIIGISNKYYQLRRRIGKRSQESMKL